LTSVLAIVLVAFYPITEAMARQVRTQLEERRGRAPAST
jgi:Na+/melibiose symporter-like transporter